MQVPIATATTTKTSVKTYVAIAAIGGASFAAAMFMAASSSVAQLAIGLSANAPDSVIVESQNEVVVLNFDLAARRESVTVNDIHFEIMAEADGDFASLEAGIDVSDYIEQCSLYQGGVLNTASSPETPTLGEIAFRSAGIVVDLGEIENFEVRCNFANPSTAHANPYAFALRMPDDTFVDAEDSNGDSLAANQILAGASDAGVNTQPRQQINLFEYGRAMVSLASDTPASDILVASTTDTVVGKWNISSLGENLNIEQLTFEMDLDATNNVSVVHLLLENGLVQTSFNTTLAVNEARFSNLDFESFAGTDTSVTLSIDAAHSSLAVGGSGQSGERVRFSFDSLDANSFEAVGAISGKTFSEDDLATKIAAAPFVYRYTKPVVTLSALSPSGAEVVGRQEALRFNLAANNAEDVTITSLAFKVASTDNAVSGWNDCTTGAPTAFTAADFTLYNLTTDGTATSLDASDTDWTFLTPARELCSATPADLGYVLIRLPQPEIVPAGQTYTFSLYVDTMGASAANDDSVRFDIPATSLDEDNDVINGIAWDDGSGQTISGYLVDALPVSGGTLVF